MSQPVRLALYGCGGISKAHVAGYQDLWERGCREFVVTACCDVNLVAANTRADEIAAFQGTRPAVFAGLEPLLKAQAAEAADICLPHCFHHSAAIGLLEGGLHVAVEKPLGITVKASKAIMAAAAKAGKVLSTSEQVRRCPNSRAYNWAINERKLVGEIKMVQVQAVAYGPFDFTKPASAWRGIKTLTGGGMIMDSGAHFADMVQVLFGEVDQVYCHMQSLDGRLIENAPVVGTVPADVEDTWQALIRFKSGVHVAWNYGRQFVGDPIRSAVYYGTEGTLVDKGFPFHPFQGGGEAILKDGTRLANEDVVAMYMDSLSEERKAALFPYGTSNDFGIEVWDFVNAIATGRHPEMGGMEGLRAKTLCEALYESATLGAPVKYDDVLTGKLCGYQAPIDAFWKL
jgi:predicted dehydrogenase